MYSVSIFDIYTNMNGYQDIKISNYRNSRHFQTPLHSESDEYTNWSSLRNSKS